MFSEKLYKKILVDPIGAGADELYIISGYATAAMAVSHIKVLNKKAKRDIKIRLIIGMGIKDGLSVSNHSGLKTAVSTYRNFDCRYHVNSPAVHSKVYTWLKKGKPIRAFVGSANYTHTAFSKRQGECLAAASPVKSLKYFNRFLHGSVRCDDPVADHKIKIYPDAVFARLKNPPKEKEAGSGKVLRPKIAAAPSIRISLLDKKNRLPKISGLNWGQRPKRERNQAYIHLPASVYKTDFFPAIGVDFTVRTDDKKIFYCHRAQANGKGIHTENNSTLGRYFRERLGVPLGQMVEKSDLSRYGRTHVDFYKIEDETYFMDFSKP